LAALTAGYFYAVGPLRRRHDLGPQVTRGQVSCFVVALTLVILALLSPVDAIGDRYLFSVHMTQHLILATAWPPLFLLSIPSWMASALFRLRGRSLLELAVYPAYAAFLFNVDIYAWHLPNLYDLTLQNEGMHILEHLSFMLLGLIVWWPVLSPDVSQRLSYPFQVLYLFANGMLMMVLGIIFTFAPDAFYPPYAAAPRLWGLSAVADQQFGGLIMWYPGNLPYAVLLIVAFYKWFDSDNPSPVANNGVRPESPTIGPPVE
jgi:putative membrane protein